MVERQKNEAVPKEPAGADAASGHRPYRVGLLLDSLFDQYEKRVMEAVQHRLSANGAQLITFICGSIDAPFHTVKQRNILYDYISPANVDGIICISGCIGNYIAAEKLQEFLLQRYANIPMVSIGTAIPGIASVCVDNYSGMRDLITHFVERHNRRNIAFIKGPDGSFDARERYRAYLDVLNESGIEYDAQLVVQSDFHPESGEPAVAELLDVRGASFDALVAANDAMAMDALRALKARGYRVPGDVAVGGFDNISDALSITPQLTTVNQPIHEVGEKAAELMCALLRGEEVPELTRLPTRMVVRGSCGCMQITRVAETRPVGGGRPSLQAVRDSTVQRLLDDFPIVSDAMRSEQWAADLADSFIEEFRGETGAFTTTVKNILAQNDDRRGDVIGWHGVVSLLGDCFLPVVPTEYMAAVVVMMKNAFFLISQKIEVVEVSRREQFWHLSLAMFRVTHEVVTAFSEHELQKIAEVELRRLGVKYCFVSLYDGVDKSRDAPMRAVINVCSGRTLPANTGFVLEQLAPGGLDSYSPASAFAVSSLFFKDEHLGIAVFDIGPMEYFVYEMLSGDLSAVLKGSQLLEETKAYAHTLEEQVSARTLDLSQLNTRLRDEVDQHKQTMQILQLRNDMIRRLNDELLEKSKIDFLTNLYNRKAFFELLHAEMQRCRRQIDAAGGCNGRCFAVMMIDLDHFKHINDTYGHFMGDQVLAQLGKMLKGILRQEDFAGRYGGEEFIVVLTSSDHEGALAPARRLMQQLEKTEFLSDSGESFHATVSIGISSYSADDADAQAIVNRADRALYYAKEHGRDQIAVFETIFMQEKIVSRSTG